MGALPAYAEAPADDGWPAEWYDAPAPAHPYADLDRDDPEWYWQSAAPATVASVAIVRLYQTALSPLRGGAVCPFVPSCSRFGLRAIVDHGALQGWLMILDRMFFREHAGLYGSSFIVARRGMGWAYDPPHFDDLTTPLAWPPSDHGEIR